MSKDIEFTANLFCMWIFSSINMMILLIFMVLRMCGWLIMLFCRCFYLVIILIS